MPPGIGCSSLAAGQDEVLVSTSGAAGDVFLEGLGGTLSLGTIATTGGDVTITGAAVLTLSGAVNLTTGAFLADVTATSRSATRSPPAARRS